MRDFTFLIADKRYSVLQLYLVEASNTEAARELAARMLTETDQHLRVEVWEGDDLLFTLGEPYGREWPSSARSSQASSSEDTSPSGTAVQRP